MINYNGRQYICLLDFAMDFIRDKLEGCLL
ncbi:transcriptional regulator, partial [Clostridium botulinum]